MQKIPSQKMQLLNQPPQDKPDPSLNSVRHGILANAVVIKKGDGRENENEFRELQGKFFEHLKPMGIIEETLIDKMVSSYWRMRRVIWAETGEIRKLKDNLTFSRTMKAIEELNFKEGLPGLYNFQDYTKSTTGIKHLRDFLKSVEEEFNAVGYLSEKTVSKVMQKLDTGADGADMSIGTWIGMFNDRASGKNMPTEITEGEEEISPEQAKRIMRLAINKGKEKLNSLYGLNKEKEGLEYESTLLSTSLPDKEIIEKIIRYESSLERSFFRNLHELQRIQAERLGKNPPLPISIDLDISGNEGENRFVS